VPVTIAAVCIVIVLGWLISKDLGRIAPAFFKRMDPATAGTVEFLIRFITVAATALGALAVAGISLQALAVGGAFTAVVLGLAAQQTLGNLIAGMVLLSARPFRLGERVRLQAGAVGGTTEGIVSSLGLLYTTLSRGEDRILIPNNVVLSAVVVPVREPESVDVRVKLGAGVRPSEVQQLLDANVTTPTRSAPTVMLEEIDDDAVVVRVRATPDRNDDGARLADEIIATLAGVTREHRLTD
jgi:small conductance mechanosensitive channel